MGELHLIIGPMFSGKTTKLIQLSELFNNPLIINYALDKRYHNTLLSTHDGITKHCIQTLMLKDISIISIECFDAILINEGQFFPDLFEMVKEFVEIYHKKVYICGLDGDFNRNPFGDILNLIPLCDTIEKRTSRCVTCINPALFTHRISSHREQVLIGVNEYIPLCRKCYNYPTSKADTEHRFPESYPLQPTL